MAKRGTQSEIEHSILIASRIMVNILAESLVHEKAEEITVPQFRILDMVYNGTTTPAEVARMLDVSPPSISELLEKLENKGLLSRLMNTSDRRKIEIALSEKGLAVVEKVNDYRSAFLQGILKKMGRQQAIQLRKSLADFNKSYAELRSGRVGDLARQDIKRLEEKREGQ